LKLPRRKKKKMNIYTADLDQRARWDGSDDASAHWPNVLEGDSLKAHAEKLVVDALSEAKNPNEYRFRYLHAYCEAYMSVVEHMRADTRWIIVEYLRNRNYEEGEVSAVEVHAPDAPLFPTQAGTWISYFPDEKAAAWGFFHALMLSPEAGYSSKDRNWANRICGSQSRPEDPAGLQRYEVR